MCSVCPVEVCGDVSCYRDGDGRRRCCHRECLGGCSGPSSRDCFVCRHVVHEGRCLSSCPPGLYKVSLYIIFQMSVCLRVIGWACARVPAPGHGNDVHKLAGVQSTDTDVQACACASMRAPLLPLFAWVQTMRWLFAPIATMSCNVTGTITAVTPVLPGLVIFCFIDMVSAPHVQPTVSKHSKKV